MYVEQTSKGLYAIQDITPDELELLRSGLIELKQHSLQDAEIFREQRTSCINMFQKIDLELVNSRL